MMIQKIVIQFADFLKRFFFLLWNERSNNFFVFCSLSCITLVVFLIVQRKHLLETINYQQIYGLNLKAYMNAKRYIVRYNVDESIHENVF